MSTVVAAPPPVPFKNRRGWLIVFGIIEILMACLFFLLGVFVVIAVTMLNHGTRPAGTPELPVGGVVMGAVFYAGLGVVFLVLGVGLIRCRNWARIATQIVSGCWLLTGLISTVFLIFVFPSMMRQQGTALPPDQLRIMFVVLGVFMGGMMVLLPGILLAFNSLPSVRATCLLVGSGNASAAGGSARSMSQTPVPVIVLAVWECLGVLAVLSLFFVRATIVFGVVVRGPGAILVMTTYGILAGITAWLIFRRDLLGWALSLGKLLFFAASWIVTLLTRDLAELYQQMGLSEVQLQLLRVAHFQLMTIIFSFVGFAIPLILLLCTKKYFFRARAGTGSPDLESGINPAS